MNPQENENLIPNSANDSQARDQQPTRVNDFAQHAHTENTPSYPTASMPTSPYDSSTYSHSSYPQSSFTPNPSYAQAQSQPAGYASEQNGYEGAHTAHFGAQNWQTTSPFTAGESSGNGSGNGNGGFGSYASPFTGGFGQPYPAPKKPKRKWSTGALAAASAFSLLIGGLLGAGVSGLAYTAFDAASSYSQQIPSMPRQQIPDLFGNGSQSSSSTALDEGEVANDTPGVVLISTSSQNAMGAGTGMVIRKDGVVVTNYHVVQDSETVIVTIPSENNKQYEAKVLGHDATHDVAVLQIEGVDDLKTVTAAKSTPDPRATVYAVGNGSGQGYLSKIEGKVTALNQTIQARDASSPLNAETLTGLIETDADVVPGYSGGALMDEDGKVVGMTTAASSGETSEEVNGYAVPIETVMDVAKQVLSGKASGDVVIGRNAALGVVISNAGQGQGAAASGAGARIVEIVSGSAAEKAGLAVGDTITAIDGEAVGNAADASSKVKEHSVGDTITVTVTHEDGSSADIQVKLGESTVN